MKVAIPVVDNQDRKYQIAGAFNTSQCICVFDTTATGYEWVPVQEITAESRNLIDGFKKKGFDAVVAFEMLPMALNIFHSLGITVYKSIGSDLRQTVSGLKENNLSIYTAQDALDHTKLCGGACDVCSTSSSCKPN